ncbi:hypothetical protein L1049_026800 [Liquidambar formosana]|uniref:Uncharacterized protein n=1 Tax=Liquidambar formosana TaxID=63359 RepID=A0AAP0NE05_LIQFO
MVLMAGEGSRVLYLVGLCIRVRLPIQAGLQLGLKEIFEVMERLSANSMQADEELCAPIADDTTCENPKCSWVFIVS